MSEIKGVHGKWYIRTILTEWLFQFDHYQEGNKDWPIKSINIATGNGNFSTNDTISKIVREATEEDFIKEGLGHLWKDSLNNNKTETMKNRPFKVGDKVKSIKAHDGEDAGRIGIIIGITADRKDNTILAKCENLNSGHSGSDKVKFIEGGRGEVGSTCHWWFNEDDLELISSLPEEYVVLCDNAEETTEVMNEIYEKPQGHALTTWSNWNFVVKLDNSNHADIFDTLPPKYSNLKQFTFQEWKQLYYNMSTKKIIGYKLKDQKYEAACRAMTTLSSLDINENNVRPNTKLYNTFKEAGVLDIWFTPVYEDEMKTETLSLGSPLKKIVVTSEKKITFEGEYESSIEELNCLLKLFTSPSKVAKNNLEIHIKKIWIGCSEGTEVTKADVTSVINAYKRLNP